MKERPILFSGEMVRAILDERKTQTRRVVKLSHGRQLIGGPISEGSFDWYQVAGRDGLLANYSRTLLLDECPYGVPGDRLWVREAWQYADWTEEGEPFIRYAADNSVRFCDGAGKGEELVDVWETLSAPDNYAIDKRAADRRWRPSIHMPRWASRLTLEIAEVRVERLQDISTHDIEREGINLSNNERGARNEYRELWNSLNAKRGYGWDVNPWVWVLTFKPLENAR